MFKRQDKQIDVSKPLVLIKTNKPSNAEATLVNLSSFTVYITKTLAPHRRATPMSQVSTLG